MLVDLALGAGDGPVDLLGPLGRGHAVALVTDDEEIASADVSEELVHL